MNEPSGAPVISTVIDGLDHPECVIVAPDGTLFAGSEAGLIYHIDPRVTPVAVRVIANTGGFVLGLALGGDGRLYVCDKGAVLRVDLEGTVSEFSTGTAERPMRTPNYPAFLHDGSLIVSDSGEWGASDGCLYRVHPDGRTVVWADATPAFPNGIALSADGGQLFVVESLPPAIRRLEILSDGSAGESALVVELPGTVPDGIAVDTEGGLVVSCYRPDRILRVAPDGGVTVLVDDPAGTAVAAPTNVAFDPTDPNRLYIANFARWHVSRITTAVAGVPVMPR